MLAAVYDVMYTKRYSCSWAGSPVQSDGSLIYSISSLIKLTKLKTYLCLWYLRLWYVSSLESLGTQSADASQDSLYSTRMEIYREPLDMVMCHVTEIECLEKGKTKLTIVKENWNWKCERPMWHWNISIFMVRPQVEIISVWQNNLPERHNNPFLYQSPHCAEVKQPERGRYICRHMGGLPVKLGIPTWK